MYQDPMYPMGVNDKVISEHFGDHNGTCRTCKFYDMGICKVKQFEFSEEELEEMDKTGDLSQIEVEKSDTCDDYDYNDAFDTDPYHDEY